MDRLVLGRKSELVLLELHDRGGFKKETLRKIWNGMQKEDLTTGGLCHEELKNFYLQPKIAEDEMEKERRTRGNIKGSKYFYLQPKIAEGEMEKERRTCGNIKGSKYF